MASKKGRPQTSKSTKPATKAAAKPQAKNATKGARPSKSSKSAARGSGASGIAAWSITWQFTGLLFLGLLVIYVASGNYSLAVQQNDLFYTALPAWAMAKFQTLNLESVPGLVGVPDWRFPVDGHLRSDRFPGAILTSVPFYWVFGKTAFSMVPSILMAATTTAGAMAFMHRALVKVAAPATALGGALLMALGTGAWTVAADAPWTHGPVMLGLAIGTWAMTTQHYATAGLGYAYAILARPHIAVVPFVVGVWEAVAKRSYVPALKVGATSSLGIAALLVYNKVNAGAWVFFPGSYEGRPSGAFSSTGVGSAPGWYDDITGTFVSMQRGWLVLSPFLLLLIPGLVRAWRAAPSWVRSSAVGGLTYLVVQLTANGYTGGFGFFSYRVTLEPLLLLVPLLAMSFDAWTAQVRWRRIVFLVLAAMAVFWHALGAFFFKADPTLLKPPLWGFEAVQAIDQAGPLGVALGVVVAGAVVGGLYYLWIAPGARQLPEDIDHLTRERKSEPATTPIT